MVRRQQDRAAGRVQRQHFVQERGEETRIEQQTSGRTGGRRARQKDGHEQSEVRPVADERVRRADVAGTGLSGDRGARTRNNRKHFIQGQRALHEKIHQHPDGQGGGAGRPDTDAGRQLFNGPVQVRSCRDVATQDCGGNVAAAAAPTVARGRHDVD